MTNFLNIALTPPADSVLYAGNYDYILVSLSLLVAVLASYAALLVSQFVSVSTYPVPAVMTDHSHFSQLSPAFSPAS
jgi:hypothetical protein